MIEANDLSIQDHEILIHHQLLMILKQHNPLYVGGYVRDCLLKLKPKDCDIVIPKLTDDLIQELSQNNWTIKQTGKGVPIYIISKSYIYREYKTFNGQQLLVKSKAKNYHIELLEYRNESLLNDALARDITINALYLNPFTFEIIDPTNKGIKDLNNETIRLVNGEQSILDDLLRIARIYRFSNKFNFEIEKNTLSFCRINFDKMLKEINSDRIRAEFDKIIYKKDT